MKTKYVVVEKYNPRWKEEFEKIKNELLVVLHEKVVSIEHVGSTSVKGIYAKPIIDIDIVIDCNFEEFKKLLESIGYMHEGNLGILGREVFKYNNKEHLMVHHIYVCNKDSEELHRHITFRNYLRNHKEDRDKYSDIKRKMALKYPEDIESYIRGKEQVILEIYRKYGLE